MGLKFFSTLALSIVFRVVLKLNAIRTMCVSLKLFDDRTKILATDNEASHASGPNAFSQRQFLLPGLPTDASVILTAGVWH